MLHLCYVFDPQPAISVLQLRISLRGLSPPVWRRVIDGHEHIVGGSSCSCVKTDLSPRFGAVSFFQGLCADLYPERHARPVPVERCTPAPRAAPRRCSLRAAHLRSHASRWFHGRAGRPRAARGSGPLRSRPSAERVLSLRRAFRAGADKACGCWLQTAS